MIGRLTGRLVEEADLGVLIIDVGGVGYEVNAPLGTGGRVTHDATGAVTLYVHTHVREDALSLFAFATPYERDTFRTLIGIANVGPKLALGVLGAVTVDELAAIVARGDSGKLTTIPGVGKKTAERLVLELKGKLVASPTHVEPSGPKATPLAGKAEVVVSTLTRMGFRPTEAERAVAELAHVRNLEEVPLGELVREALSVLSK